MEKNEATTIQISESSRERKGKAPLLAAVEHGRSGAGYKRGVAIFDLVLRISAATAALAATVTMATTEQTLPFFTQFFQFQASYDDLPTFTRKASTDYLRHIYGDFGYFRGRCLGGDSVPGSQRKLRRELAGDMPTVYRFLPEDQRSGGGVVCGGGAAHFHGGALRHCPKEALMKEMSCIGVVVYLFGNL
ncbi:hypothetical protein BUALT_Bualt02G0244500 [Buddleja alternifolia]|uniref:CASP-like protein n=1 Tax=Buddleja alternifolia TaxID=168488 RepID=A0AAV6Y309_9LAMI|nr:hypothetical protein BUALT_Bualt02G0244500 [Buddleja alternifolia]